MHTEDAALSRLVPSIDPIQHIDSAAGSERHVARIQAPEQLSRHGFGRIVLKDILRIIHRVAGAFRLDGKIADAAGEIRVEKVIAIGVRQPRARIVRDARRTVADEPHRRKQREVRFVHIEMPHPFAIPCAQLGLKLPPDAPAVVCAFHDMGPARLVPPVRVVVSREKIAHVVECQRLRVAQAGGHEFHAAAVEIATEDRAAVRVINDLPFFGRHVGAAIGNRPVKLSIRPQLCAMHVMPAISNVDSESGEQFLAGRRLGLAVAR